jgi:hypothetical protein
MFLFSRTLKLIIWNDGLQLFRVAANIRVLNKQPNTDDKEWSFSLGVGSGANNTSLKNRILLRSVKRTSDLDDFLGLKLITYCGGQKWGIL